MTRDDVELYVMGQYDGDVAALERAIADDPDIAGFAAEASRLELLLRDAGAAAAFCIACHELVRDQRCDACGAAVRPGGYAIERVLVANAHGRMYVARDVDGKQVALKELAFVHAPSEAALAAFEREAKLLRALEHPSIPRFVASFEEGTGVHLRYYLAQELVVGTPLDRFDDHWYGEAEVVQIGAQVLASLVYLQQLSPMVIHRDIKPANLLRRSDGTIALVDFGAAHVQGTTAGSTTIGTFGYMPIEQLAGEVDATTDVYALGMTLVHLLTREEPWRIAQSRTAINASAPLRAFLDRMIAPAPSDRFPSAKAALAALETLGDVRATAAPPPRRWRLPVGRAVLAMAATAVLATSAFGIYELTRPAPRVAVPEPRAPERVVVVSPPPAAQPPPPVAPLIEITPATTPPRPAPPRHAPAPPPPPAPQHASVITTVDPVNDLLTRLKHGEVTAAQAREQLRTIPPDHPAYVLAVYWIAALSMRDLDDWDTARTTLDRLASMPTDIVWIAPWTLLRQAMIAEHDGDTDRARTLWAKAKAAAAAAHYGDRELDYYLGLATKTYGLE